MKKYLLICLLASILFTSKSFAQIERKDKFSGGLELGLPLGNLSTMYDRALGASIMYQREMGERLFLTGNLGYINFRGTVRFGNANLKKYGDFVPIKVGAKYYVANKVYGAGEVGAAISSGNIQNGISFAYAPAIGTEIGLAKRSSIDVSVRYEAWAKNVTSSFLGLRTALIFGN